MLNVIPIIISLVILFVLILLKLLKVHLSKGLLSIIYLIYFIQLFVKIITYPIKDSTDYLTYLSFINTIKRINLYQVWDYNHFELFFRYLCWFLVRIFEDNTLLVIVLVTNIIIVIALYRTFDDKLNSIIALCIYLYAPLFFSMSTNIIRQSLVIALILLTLTIKSKAKFFIVLIMPFIHASSWVFVIYFIFNKYIKTKYLGVITIFSALLFLTGTNKILFTTLGYRSTYTEINVPLYNAIKNSVGNRIDFFLLTTTSTIISYFLYKRKQLNQYIYKYILVSSILFYCIGFQGFSDRLAIYNWWTLLICIPLFINYILEGKRKI